MPMHSSRPRVGMSKFVRSTEIERVVSVCECFILKCDYMTISDVHANYTVADSDIMDNMSMQVYLQMSNINHVTVEMMV